MKEPGLFSPIASITMLVVVTDIEAPNAGPQACFRAAIPYVAGVDIIELEVDYKTWLA